jgi:PPOX class probable F420-dependent enzyme
MTTFPDSHKDLLDAPVASLATVGPDGYPQSTLIWFVHDQGELRLSLNATRLKTKNLLKNPKVSLLILDPSTPMRYLEIRGDAVAAPDQGFGAGPVKDKYNADVSAHDGPGEERLVITIKPTNIYPVDMRG